jgi:hypothetical protein
MNMNPIRVLVRGILAGSFSIWLATPCDAALVYYIPFDDGTSATLANYGITGGVATATGTYDAAPAASTDIYTNLGGARSENFPYSANHGGRLDLPSGSTPFRMTNTSERMTVSAWLKLNARNASGGQTIVSTMPGAQNTGWEFYVNNNGTLAISLGGVGVRFSTSATIVPTNVWTHVAMTYATKGNPTFYINGVNVGLNQSYYSASAIASTVNIELGTIDGTYYPIMGKMDDVAVFDTNLSDGKICAMVTAPSVIPGFNVGIMNQLFNLYDTASGTTTITNGTKRQTWSYATGLTGHTAGDTWMDSTGNTFIQFDSSNNGVKNMIIGTLVKIQ